MYEWITQQVPVSVDRIKKIEYHTNGMVKSIELHPVQETVDPKHEPDSLTDLICRLKNRG